jgi:hypothetical protein
VINLAFGRSVLTSVLFARAVAVGLTPQLLPAIVTASLSTGARRLAEHSAGRPIARPRPPRHRLITHRASRWSTRHLHRRATAATD